MDEKPKEASSNTLNLKDELAECDVDRVPSEALRNALRTVLRNPNSGSAQHSDHRSFTSEISTQLSTGVSDG